jgi:hypothetical protein
MWEESLKTRGNKFFNSLTSKLKLVQKETELIDSSFQKLGVLKIESEWKFDYAKVERYFDKEAVKQFGGNIANIAGSLEMRVGKEQKKFLRGFGKETFFDKMEKKIKEEGTKKYGSMEAINRDSFKMFEELSVKVMNGDWSNQE